VCTIEIHIALDLNGDLVTSQREKETQWKGKKPNVTETDTINFNKNKL
jgi:hypothetical protein